MDKKLKTPFYFVCGRRFFAALILTALLASAAGCSVLNTGALNLGIAKLDLDKEQSLTAKIHFGRDSEKRLVTAKLHRFGTDVWESSISDPYPLQGINVYRDKGETTLIFGDLSVVENPAFACAMDVVVASLENAFTASPKIKAHRKTIALTGETAFGGYTLKFENKIPKTLEIPNREIKVEFA